MKSPQLIALLLGASVGIVLAALAWKGMLPGMPQPQQGPASNATASAPSAMLMAKAPPPSAASSPTAPSNSSMMMAAKPPAASAASSPAAPANNAMAAAKPPVAPSASTQAVPAAPEQTEAPKPQLEASLPPRSAEPPSLPEFDTVRVEPSGDIVVAGHGEADAKVDLLAGDKVLSQVEADGAGNFVMIPDPLLPGVYVLGLRSTDSQGATLESHQNVTVSVPAKGQKNVVVALAEPGKPSVVLSDTETKSVAKPQSFEPASASKTPSAPTSAALPPPATPLKPEVAFKTAEVDNGGFYASGSATPGEHLRLYLNGSFLADITAGNDGHWSLTIGKGVTPGHYAVRADLVDVSGKVLARAEVPFDVPVSVAEANVAVSPPPLAVPQPPGPKVAPQQSASPKAAPQTSAAAAPPKTAPEAAAKPALQPHKAPAVSAVPAASSAPAAPVASAPPAPAQPMAEESAHASAPVMPPAPASGTASAQAPQQTAAASGPPPHAPNDVVIPQIDTATVVHGDSLWRISRKVFGHGIRYTLIYEANAKQIRDPNLIYPGQVFVLPHVD